jgi:hypothetical protein
MKNSEVLSFSLVMLIIMKHMPLDTDRRAESHDVSLIEIIRCSGISHSGVVQEYPSRILEIFSLMFFSIALKHTPFDRAHRAASNEVVFMTGTHFRVNRHMKQSVKGSSQTF